MLAFYLSLIDTPEDRNKFEILYQKYKQLLFHLAFRFLYKGIIINHNKNRANLH